MTIYANVGHILLKRGNTVQSTAYTGPLGELTYDTDLRTIRVHDGSTVGGNVILINQTTLTAYQTYANANAATQANGINTINANIGSFYTYANANAATQATSIASVNANVTASDSAIGSLRANITAANSAIQALSANIGTLVAGAPGALDTLLELGNALGNSSSFSSTMVVWLGNITSNVTAANSRITTLDANLGTATTNITTLFSNAATQATGIDAITANIGGSQTYANTQVNTISANLGAYQTYANLTFSTVANAASQGADITTLLANATTQATGINTVNANLGAYQTYGNLTFSTVANAATQAADITTLYSNAATQATSIDTINANITAANTAIQSLSANIGTLVANAPGALDTLAEIDAALGNNASFSSVMVTWLGNITTNVTTANTSIDTINANLGAYLIYANANAATQAESIATLQTQVYANANVAAYLPTYTGDIAANIVKNGYTWTFGTDGDLSFPGSSNGRIADDEPGIVVYSDNGFAIQSNVTGDTVHNWVFGTDGQLTLPTGDTNNGRISNINGISLAVDTSFWTFGTDGSLTFPTGGNLIFDSSATSMIDGVTSITANGNVNASYFFGNGSELTNLPAPTVTQDITSTGAMSIMLYDGVIKYNNYATVEPSSGNIAAGNVTATQYNFANGVNILSTVGASAYGNTQVAEYLANYDGIINFTASPAIINTGEITAANVSSTNGFFWGNGTPYSTGGGAYGNTEVASYLLQFDGDIEFTSSTAKIGNVDVITVGDSVRSPSYQFSNGVSIFDGITGTYSNTNVAAYLTTATISTTGNVTVTGNITGNTAGFAIGYRDIPQITFAANATTTVDDAGKHFYSTSASSLILTVANNASQSFATGATMNIINQGSGTITVAQGSGVTLYLAGNSTSGNRTISSYGLATITKVATDTWFIVGAGVS